MALWGVICTFAKYPGSSQILNNALPGEMRQVDLTADNHLHIEAKYGSQLVGGLRSALNHGAASSMLPLFHILNFLFPLIQLEATPEAA